MSSVYVVGLQNRTLITVPTPNTPIYQILQTFCEKHGLEISKHALRKGNKILDLSVPWRLAGIPTKSDIEIFETKTNFASSIQVALQLPTGNRFGLENISLQTSLLQLLIKCEQVHNINLTRAFDTDGSYFQPSVAIVNNYFKTLKDLHSTTLESLGLRGTQNCLFRLNYEKNPELKQTDQTFIQMLEQLRSLSGANNNENNNNQSIHSTTSESKQEHSTSNLLPQTTADLTPETHTSVGSSNHTDVEVNTSSVDEHSHIWKQALPGFETLASNIKLFKRVDSSQMNKFDPRDLFDDSDISDADFELTPQEIKKMMVESQKKREEAETLVSQKVKEAEKLKKAPIYSKCIVRFRFSNYSDYILQATFESSTTISQIRKFIDATLLDPSTNYMIFITPPIQKIDVPENMDKSLKQLNLTPASILNVGPDRKKGASPNPSALNVELKPEVLQLAKEINTLREVVEKLPENENKAHANDFDVASSSSSSSKTAPNNRVDYQNRPSSSSDSKKPKWFKP